MSDVKHKCLAAKEASKDIRIAYSVPEFSDILGIAVRTGWKLVNEREIAHLRVGKRVLITIEAIEDFKKRNTVSAREPE